MPGDGSGAAFWYQEPTIATVLNQAGFLLILNLVNVCLDKLLYCGLIGQLFIGILWGTPGAKWLDRGMETVVQQLGYLGLIMLVYEGGLTTSIKSIKANLLLSLCVALTGIGVPIALSFMLMELVSASPLQAFAAGAALSATSLGTTFTILSTTKLIATRLGTVTKSAAMLDDVVGLVMVQVILNIGGDTSSISAVTVIRPLFVSIGFAVILFMLCAFCVKPILKKAFNSRFKLPKSISSEQFAFLAQTGLLISIVAGATYAGVSSLFAAYLAGVAVSWSDELAMAFNGPATPQSSQSPCSGPGAVDGQSDSQEGITPQNRPHNTNSSEVSRSGQCQPRKKITPGVDVYEKYYRDPVRRILVPLFFASIGFSIPITEMFQGSVVWRGVIYAILMTFGKMVTGLWLVRFELSPILNMILVIRKPFSFLPFFGAVSKGDNGKSQQTLDKHPPVPSESLVCSIRPDKEQDRSRAASSLDNQHQPASSIAPHNPATSPPPKPRSLYPPSILGLAMVARGEIGYLIASLAESQGIFSSGSSEETSEIYLVTIWAISICTLIGPISVGTLAKRLKTLQQSRETSGADPLWPWGI